MKHFYMLDGRSVWWPAASRAALRFGYHVARVVGEEWRERELRNAVGFVRPDAHPARLRAHQAAYHAMKDAGIRMVQDDAQIDLYEDKRGQTRRWGRFMPETRVFTTMTDAVNFARECDYPIVSKADVGASSVNVRVLRNRLEAARHVQELFGRGVPVRHCSGGATSRQKGYALLQRFVPHEVTWRVNVIGAGRAVFRRFNYKNKPVAQTGNVAAVTAMDETVESLLEFADEVARAIGSRWVALDILQEGDSWRLLETSLAWPWNEKDHAGTPIFRTDFTWGSLWDCMFDQIESGHLAASSSSTSP